MFKIENDVELVNNVRMFGDILTGVIDEPLYYWNTPTYLHILVGPSVMSLSVEVYKHIKELTNFIYHSDDTALKVFNQTSRQCGDSLIFLVNDAIFIVNVGTGATARLSKDISNLFVHTATVGNSIETN